MQLLYTSFLLNYTVCFLSLEFACRHFIYAGVSFGNATLTFDKNKQDYLNSTTLVLDHGRIIEIYDTCYSLPISFLIHP